MATRSELIQAFLPQSPFFRHLGMRIEAIEADRAVLVLPFSPEVVTIGDTVHGGAISTLIDTAAVAAAWGSDEEPDSPTGSTVSLTVNFAAAARGQDLTATARVVRRRSAS